METRFKYGDPTYPKWNEDFFDGRYQNKMRNGNRSRYSMEIGPLSYKVISWRDYGNWAKRDAHQAARHNAKLMVIKLAHIIMDELWQEEQALMWEDDDWYDDDWYDDHPMDFNFSYSDDDFLDYSYDPHMDWDY